MRELQLKQMKLDNFIYESNNILNVEGLLYDKLVALDVELGEFMNEIKSFKYWKKNKLIDKSKVIEEACDCLHFVLSIANDLDINLSHSLVVTMEQLKANDINTIYRYIKATIWKDIYTDDNYESIRKLVPLLVIILEELGFTYNDLLSEYDRKYEINIKRQVEGY